jgi:hypothetical protein
LSFSNFTRLIPTHHCQSISCGGAARANQRGQAHHSSARRLQDGSSVPTSHLRLYDSRDRHVGGGWSTAVLVAAASELAGRKGLPCSIARRMNSSLGRALATSHHCGEGFEKVDARDQQCGWVAARQRARHGSSIKAKFHLHTAARCPGSRSRLPGPED